MDIGVIVYTAELEAPALRETARRIPETEAIRFSVPLGRDEVLRRQARGGPTMHVMAAADELVRHLGAEADPLSEDSARLLRAVQGAENIRLNFDQHLSSVWSAPGAAGHVTVGKLWEYYCQYPYLPRLTERAVLERGIHAVFGLLTWETQGFAVATGYDAATGRYARLALPHEDTPPQLTDSTLLVRPDLARAQRDSERAAAAAAEAARRAAEEAGRTDETGDSGTSTRGDEGTGLSGGGGSATGSTDDTGGTSPDAGGTVGGETIPGPAGGSTSTTPPAPKNVRFYGTVSLDPERYARDFGRLYQEVIQHLAAPDDVDLKITVEIEAVKKDGFPDDKARIVSENARTLNFDQSGFEDH